MRQMRTTEFWKTKTLLEMSNNEWESLCDGCGKCCLNKFMNEKDEVFYTDVACRLLDLKTCKCRNYKERSERVPDCKVLTPSNINKFTWLPSTCAYRLISEGKPLAKWHPLISGDVESVHENGVSVKGRVLSEDDCIDLECHIVEWSE